MVAEVAEVGHTERVVAQLLASGCWDHVRSVQFGDGCVTGYIGLKAIVMLRKDPQFTEGGLHRLHADVGDDLTEFRSDRGAFGKGSMQIVIDKTTGKFYADCDAWSPYMDLVNWVGHAGEVIGGWWKRRKQGAAV